MSDEHAQITVLLHRLRDGDREAESALLPLVYDQLHRLAVREFNGERPGHTLQPTALINELYLRIIRDASIDWQSRAHLYAVAATTIRRILVDHARAANAKRRPGPKQRVPLEDVVAYSPEQADDLLVIDEVLTKLAGVDARQAKIVELRFFGGFSNEETARVLGLSERTVKRDWTMARAWLAANLEGIADD